jgi:hypothetical protein
MMGLIMRTSTGDRATWSPARQIGAYGQANVATLKTQEGYLIISADGPDSTTAIYISKDGGTTWTDPPDGRTMREYAGAGGTGPRISGIHAGIVQREDSRLLALGRHDHPGQQERFNGRAPTSISSDLGRTWTYSASELPAISSSQRLALLKVKEGPLLYCSLTNMVPRETRMARFSAV